LHSVERDDRIDGKAGVYRAEFFRDDTDYRLLVEADGYRTALSPPSLVCGPNRPFRVSVWF
jgi:hypothetical protein